MARTILGVVSSLPEFRAKRSEDFRAWLIVTCPREDCGDTFLVKKVTWMKERKTDSHGQPITSRACPYCFKASRLPQERAIR